MTNFYLRDLTAQCELKAREWDQQSARARLVELNNVLEVQ